MKHRYIFSGVVWENPEICYYRLISKTTYSLGQFVRVNIPNDLILTSYSGDGYSTTDDKRTVHELGCDCYILFNGCWRKFNYLKKFEPHQWFRVLNYIFGLYNCCDDKIGCTDDVNLWKKIVYSDERKELSRKYSTNEAVKHYPPVKEDKNGLKLKVNLNNDIDFLRNSSLDKEWIEIYDQYELATH